MILNLTVSQLPDRIGAELEKNLGYKPKSKKKRSAAESLSLKKFMESLIVTAVRKLGPDDVKGFDLEDFCYKELSVQHPFDLNEYLLRITEEERRSVFTELYASEGTIHHEVIDIPQPAPKTDQVITVDILDLVSEIDLPSGGKK